VEVPLPVLEVVKWHDATPLRVGNATAGVRDVSRGVVDV